MTRPADLSPASEKLRAHVRAFDFDGVPLLFAGLAAVQIVVKLHGEINDLLKNPQFRDTMIARGAIPIGGSSEEFGGFMRPSRMTMVFE
ncbi:MAG: hypothetical protein ACXWIT_27910 [Burkholderiales bacterium]